MKQIDEKTIEMFSERSNSTVTQFTLMFALTPAVIQLLAVGMSYSNGSQLPNLYGTLSMVWVPLCFVTIPPIHYLCRRVKQLESKLDELAAFVRAKEGDAA